jgi:hypothetical protein
VFDEGKETTLNGTLDVTVHFFEQGNVHLKTNDNLVSSVPWKVLNNDNNSKSFFSYIFQGDINALAKEIVNKIGQVEQDYETSIDDSFLRFFFFFFMG